MTMEVLVAALVPRAFDGVDVVAETFVLLSFAQRINERLDEAHANQEYRS